MALQKYLIPFFIIIINIISFNYSFPENPLENFVDEASGTGYDSQAYPSYLRMIGDGNDIFEDLIKQSRDDVSSLKIFDQAAVSTVNVSDFGAEGDGETDDTEAFEKAWMVACSSDTAAVLVVPQKIYWLKPIRFSGPCESQLTVQILGTLEASDDRSDFSKDGGHWLIFDSVRNLLVDGGGAINGNGKQWWQNSCKIDQSKPCRDAPTVYMLISQLLNQSLGYLHGSFWRN